MVMCPLKILIIALNHSMFAPEKSAELVKIARQVGYVHLERSGSAPVVVLPEVEALLCV